MFSHPQQISNQEGQPQLAKIPKLGKDFFPGRVCILSIACRHRFGLSKISRREGNWIKLDADRLREAKGPKVPENDL